MRRTNDRKEKKPVLTKYVQLQLNGNLLIDRKLKWLDLWLTTA